MLESDKLYQIQTILAESKQIQNFLLFVRAVCSKHNDFSHETFTNSSELQFTISQLNELRIPNLNHVLKDLIPPDAIIALPIKIEAKFTLFFVIVPEGKMFNWHNHPKMTGLSKCVHGSFTISAMDYNYIQAFNSNYIYPKNKVRVENIASQDPVNVSTIYPESFNFHQIYANEFSAFFDLLMPDYPQNLCDFFTTIDDNGDFICLSRLPSAMEQIRGFDVQLKLMQEKEKHQVKNVILKGFSF